MQPAIRDDKQFLRDLQEFLARYATLGGTFRGCPAGTTQVVREYLAEIPLARFVDAGEDGFVDVLDSMTKELQKAMPGQEWGFARKALNVFLRDCCYNRFTYDRYRLGAIEPLLEVPLDNIVAVAIIRKETVSAQWDSIGRLDPATSESMQAAAGRIAKNEGILRVHLDTAFWGKRS